jgi:PPM family protein phosphatase
MVASCLDPKGATVPETYTFERGLGILKVTALSDVGKVRSHNEDSFAVLPEQGLLIVSDGMGGHNAGGLASKIVVEALPQMIFKALQSLQEPSIEQLQDVVRDSAVDLSNEICKRTRREPDLAGMGATFVLAMFLEKKAIVAHMGDSRGYLFRSGELRLLTEDHSVVGLLLREGQITPKQASEHPARGQLSRYVGMQGEVFPDVLACELVSGDRVLLCTDGLTGEVSDSKIGNILNDGVDLKEISTALIDAANKAEGADNITVVLAEWSLSGAEGNHNNGPS